MTQCDDAINSIYILANQLPQARTVLNATIIQTH